MKKIFLTIWLVVLSAAVIGQNYTIHNHADDMIAGYAEEIIKENTPNDTRQYDFTLTQNGNAFAIAYLVMPDNIRGEEHTDNVWNELEGTISRVFYSIEEQIAQKAVSAIQYMPVAQSEPEEQSYQQPVQYQQYPQQSQVQATSVSSTKKPKSNKLVDAFMSSALVKVSATQEVMQSAQLYQTQQYTLSDVQAGKASIGGCLTFEDGTKGIIFYLDHQGHGLVVSLDHIAVKWENVNKAKECHDILMLPNEVGSETCTYGLGANNTSIIINQLGIYNAPAAAWCVSHGAGWYLPSSGELWYLMAIANAKSGAGGLISLSLINMEGSPLDSKWYWSSSENDQDEAINVSLWGSISSEKKVNLVGVRAIKAF